MPAASRAKFPTRVDLVLMAAIAAWGIFRLAPNLSHPSISSFDESFHQLVTRHVYDHPMVPTLIEDPVHEAADLSNYWESRVWLIKPPGAFWFGALMMIFTGKVPLAFRIGGLLSEIFAALTIYALAVTVSRRLWALVASLGFLSLPVGWMFTQARFVSDELDLMLCACICAAMICLFLSINKASSGWAALAGAFTGVGYLVKGILALAPIGIATCLYLLSRVGFCQGPRLKALVLSVATATAVAGPWNFYAAQRWPAVYRAASAEALTHILPERARLKAPQWIRPPDAVFNEMNQALYDPMPAALVLVAGAWLIFRAIRKREVIVVGAAVWLWATWIAHSLVAIKMHNHLWNSVVAGFIGMAIVLEDVWSSSRLAFTTCASIATPFMVTVFPSLSRVREWVPKVLFQTRNTQGLAEGLCMVGVGLALGSIVNWGLTGRRRDWRWIVGTISTVALGWLMLWKATAKQAMLATEMEKGSNIAYSQEVGPAIEAQTGKKSLLLLDIDRDPPGQVEVHNLAFWSDRLVHAGRDPGDYPQAGYHPYLVSSSSEPYAPLSVPADAWLRAYDLAAAQPGPQPLPAGVRPLAIAVGNLRVLGFATGRADRKSNRYAFYVRSEQGLPNALPVAFQTKHTRQSQIIEPEAALRVRARLADRDWFILPALGPPVSEVQVIEFGERPDQQLVLQHGGQH